MVNEPLPTRFWLHHLGVDGLLPVETIIDCLAGTGIVVDKLEPGYNASGPGIVALSKVNPETCSLIQTVSRDGTERVLVLVPRAASALSNGDAWRVLQAGASDLLAWHDLPDPAAVIAARLERWNQVEELLNSPLVKGRLVGESRAWKNVLRQVVEAARFTDAPILLTGETGTGKELVAHLIHALDPRRSQHALVILDCTTIVPDLSGSELFGHERGAFTGAVAARDGAFALADQGTLFLDEVGELPLTLQVQLLRVLQEYTYKRVGSNVWRKTNFRLVCATNRDLQRDEVQGRFRRDLYYRITCWTFRLPPLRERPRDILPLVRHFMKQARPDQEPPELDPQVQAYFVTRAYPGNVRDLRSLVFRMMSRHVGPGPITVGGLPAAEWPAVEPDLQEWLNTAFRQTIRRALARGAGLRDLTHAVKNTTFHIAVEDEDGNLQRAARRLGVTDRTVQMWRAKQSHVPMAASPPGLEDDRAG